MNTPTPPTPTPTAAARATAPAAAPAVSRAKPARQIDLLVIHCSATPSGQPISSGTPDTPSYKDSAQVIDGWHLTRGFTRTSPLALSYNSHLKHIGYHYVISHGGIVLSARHPDEVGAHAAGFNGNSLGICLVGGAEKVGRYTMNQWEALASLVVDLCHKHPAILLAPPMRTYYGQDRYTETGGVCGHRDLSPDLDGDKQVEPGEWLKTCPGFDVKQWLKNGMHPDPAHIFPT